MRLAFIIAALFSTATFAQSPQLLVKDGDKPHPIALSKADIHVEIAGQFAQTTMTLTFRNDADRVLEGELVFPLPENAAVCSYALDVNGTLVDAVTIDKDKARVVFETEVRKGVDPGIVEKVQGNNFRTRIYPIPARGVRTVRVQYVSDLVATSPTDLAYSLPLNWESPVAAASIKVEVIKSAIEPKIAAGGLDNLKFAKWEDRFVAEQKFENIALKTTLSIALPEIPKNLVAIEKKTKYAISVENLDPKTIEQFARTDYYFAVTNVPPADLALVDAQSIKPARIAIAWDASLSRGDVDHKRELALLEKHIKSLGDVIVEVVAFRNTPDAARTFWIKKGDATEVLKYLSSTIYDGGTALSAVEFGKRTVAERNTPRDETLPAIAYWLLCSDGLSNLGPDLPAKVETPIYSITADPRANHALLRHLSAKSGGAYINLGRLTDDQAVASLTASPYSLISVAYNKDEVADVYPSVAQPVQGRITIAGKLLAKSAKITLNYGRGQTITQSVPIELKQDGATETGLIPRYWAQAKLSELGLDEDRNQSEIASLGKEFNLVTAFTSMIVLERVEQYVEYKIIPPKTRPEVYTEFMKQIEQNHAVAKGENESKINRVLAMWNNRLAWWNQKFEYAADLKFKNPATKGEIQAVAGTAGAALADGAAPHPLPTPMPNSPAVNSPRPADSAPQEHGEGRPALGLERGGRSERARNQSDMARREGGASNSTAAQREAGAAGGGRAQGGGGGGGGGGLFGGGGVAAGDDRRSDERTVEQLARDPHGPFTGVQRDTIYNAGKPSGDAKGDINLATITIKEWSPDAPYLKALAAAKPEDQYALYSDQSKQLRSTPAFYLDCAEFFEKHGQRALAIRILTNIPELGLDDGRLLRIAAHKLQEMGELDLAIDLFEKVAKLRPEEPQSFRDLALALAGRAESSASVGTMLWVMQGRPSPAADYARSLELLHKVVMNQWQRFDEIEVIALMEANRIIARSQSLLATGNPQLATHANPFDPRLIKLLDPDLRIVLTWDTDNTDIDLHVVEPTGEECFYSHNRTTIGGAMSRDFTQGYGPEEYILRKLMPGEYKIKVHFYGNRDQKLVGPTTVQATVITNFGKATEKRQALTLRLKDAKDWVDVGSVTLKP